jgi:hypothetical protein
MSFLSAVGEFAELLDWFRAGFTAWRYLLSPSYRRRIHDRWRSAGRLSVFFDIVGASFAFVFTLALVVLLVCSFVYYR